MPHLGDLFKTLGKDYKDFFKESPKSHKNFLADLSNQCFKLKQKFTQISSKNQQTLKLTLVEKKKSSLISDDKIWRMITTIRKAIMEKILVNLPSLETMKLHLQESSLGSNQNQIMEIMHKKLCEEVMSKSAEKDQAFLGYFLKTQMFHMFVQNYY